MKKNSSLFEFSADSIKFRYGKTVTEPFGESTNLNFLDERFSYPDKLNVLAVSPKVYSEFKNEIVLLTKKGSKAYVNVTLRKRENIDDSQFLASSHIKEEIGLTNGDEVELCRYKKTRFNKIMTQKIDFIRENELVLSQYDADGNKIELDEYKYFELYNPITCDNIIVKRSHIRIDEELKNGTIRLNRKQRFCLGCELVHILTPWQWEILENNLNEAELSLIKEIFVGEDHLLDKTSSFKQKLDAKNILSRYFANELRMIPVLRSGTQRKKSLARRLSDLYVGKSTTSLICRRPYDNDEGLDIVRMTRSNMNLLGIDEMDKVILQYKNKRVSTRVLELDDDEAFLETNQPISTDLVVCLPVHIRKQLGVLDLNSTVKVDRDTAFIFKKSINEQIVPVLLTLFSTNLFNDVSVILSAALSVLAIPIVLYFNLSSKRNMRA
ncbi:MAG: hypothetical protein IJN75_01840 [Clostridia bacterium]|nr:hypothetical protein [Clostridia bacterium]